LDLEPTCTSNITYLGIDFKLVLGPVTGVRLTASYFPLFSLRVQGVKDSDADKNNNAMPVPVSL